MPSDGAPGLSLQGARALARMLRGAAEVRPGGVVEAVAWDRARRVLLR